MNEYEVINTFLVDIWGRINKIEERSLTAALGEDISVTEIHIIEKIGNGEPKRMSQVSAALGVTMSTLTVACDKLEFKEFVSRERSVKDKRVVNVSLTAKGRAVYECHKNFHERMVFSALEDFTPDEVEVLSKTLLKIQNFLLFEE